MTTPPTDNLKPEGVGGTKAEDDAIGEVRPLDWRHPRYFDQEQRNRLAAMMTQAAAVLSERFVHFYNQPFDVSITSIAEHFAGQLQNQIATDESLCMTFGPNANQMAGFLTVSAATAFNWATQLLGDQDSQASADRTLSGLEQSLLSDLMTALLEAFLPLLRAQKDMKPAAQVVKGWPAVPFETTQEISTIAFQAKKANADTAQEITFVLPCNMLAPLVGKPIPTPPKLSADELSRMLMEHLQEMPVNVTAVLGSSWLSFNEAVDLNPDDVLMLDKTVDVPIELRINDRPVFWGHPAQSEGQYAALLTAAAGAAKDVKPAAPEPVHNAIKQNKKG
jgi:flagellar motor switch protein FliM